MAHWLLVQGTEKHHTMITKCGLMLQSQCTTYGGL